jgi:hypothetical protein
VLGLGWVCVFLSSLVVVVPFILWVHCPYVGKMAGGTAKRRCKKTRKGSSPFEIALAFGSKEGSSIPSMSSSRQFDSHVLGLAWQTVGVYHMSIEEG